MRADSLGVRTVYFSTTETKKSGNRLRCVASADSMSQEIYLHIGFHKTGTTAIQAFMAGNAPMLKGRRVLYPEAGRAGNSHALLANSLKRANISLDAERLYAELADEAARTDCAKVVVSSECFMENIPPEVIAQRLSKTGLTGHIIVYLRRQDLWLQSLYNEVVRDPSRRYTGRISNMREVRQGMADYHKVITDWANCFGKDSIVIRILEKEQLPHGLYRDFLDAIGVECHDDYWVPSRSAELNPGFSDVLILALRCLNQIPMKREMYRHMISALAEIAQDPAYIKSRDYSLLSTDEAGVISRKYAAGNRKLAKEYLGRPNGILFYSTHAPQDTLRYQLSSEEERDIFSRLPDEIRQHCIKMRPRLASPEGSKSHFLPAVPASEEQRLRAVIHRMRLELNWLYEERDRDIHKFRTTLDNYPPA